MSSNYDLFAPAKKEEEPAHTEDSIVKLLRQRFNQGYTYRINNAFIYAPDWECDFFCMNRDGYAFEFEIKISRADFQNDFQKYKHILFKKPDKHGLLLPNKFYYVVPEGMVTAEEIPKYAGLIYITGHANVIKRAPFIHKAKRDYRKILCDKFYDRYIAQRREFVTAKHDIANAKMVLKHMEEHIPQDYKQWLRSLGLLKG